MGKKSKVALYTVLGLIGLAYALFLFALPALISLDSFKSEITGNVESQTGLKVDYEKLKLTTHYNLNVGAIIQNAVVLSPDDKKIFSVKQASVNIPLFPLIFKKLEISDVKIDSPEISLTRLKTGEFELEKMLTKPKETSVAKPQAVSQEKQSAPAIVPVFNGLNATITNYKINLFDKSLASAKNFTLQGDILEVSDFNPEKYMKLNAKGQLLIENSPNIKFDVVLASELPLVKEVKQKVSQESKVATTQKPAKTVNPLEGLVKYDFKSDIVADLRLKRGENIPEITGFFDFDKLSLKVKNARLPDSNGKLKFFGKKFDIASKLFITPNSFLEIAGKINNIAKHDYDINVKTSDIMLADVQNFAFSLADAVGADTQTLKNLNLSGKLKADFNIHKKDWGGSLRVTDAKIAHKGISKSLHKVNLGLNFNKDKAYFENTNGLLGDIRFDVIGYVTSGLDVDVKASIPSLKMATVFSIANNSKLLSDLKLQLKDIKYVSGDLRAVALIKGDLNKESTPLVTIDKFNTKIIAKNAPMPVKLTGGEVVINAKDVNVKNLQVSALTDPISVSGKISDYAKTCYIDLNAEGRVLASDVKKFGDKSVQKDLKIKQALPLAAKITGTPENVDVNAQLGLNGLAYIVELDHTSNISNILNIGLNIKPTSLYFSNTGVFAGKNLPKDNIGIYKLASASKLLSIGGYINSYNTKPFLHNVKVDASGLNLKLIEPKGKLQVNGNFAIEGKALSPRATGNLNIKKVSVPAMLLKADNIDLAFKNQEITLNTGVINLVDSQIVLAAALQNKLSPPFVVNSMQITSDFLNLDKLNKAFAALAPAKPAATPKKSAAKSSAKAISKPVQSDIPLIINNGKFVAKKLVASNLLNENLSFDFVINPLNIMKIYNFITYTGGGTAKGVIDMNLKTTKLNLDCVADNIEINALASTLAQTPNEIYGAMKGRVQLTTMGNTPEQMTQNAVGRVDFNILNGHLPKLGSIQYLLGANNLFRKGLSNSVLSNTLGFKEAEKTNHFDNLNGLVLINNGVLEIQEISMQGKYLSSFISGTLRMKDNYSNITVLGKLSGKIVRQLGPIADISIDKLLRQLPGQWGQLLADQRVLNQYPNRDRIPALSTDPLPEQKDFAVKIDGNLNRPRAVRMFEWLQ